MKKFYIPTYIVVLLLVVIAGTTLWYFGYHRPIMERITMSPAKKSDIEKVPSSEAEGQNMKQQYSDRSTHGDSNVDASDDGETSKNKLSNENPVTPSTPNKVETHPSQKATSIDPETAALLEKADVLLEESRALRKEYEADSDQDEQYVKRAFSSLANRFKTLSSEKKREVLNDVRDMFLNPERFVSHLHPDFQKSYVESLKNMTEDPEFKQEVQSLLSDTLRE